MISVNLKCQRRILSTIAINLHQKLYRTLTFCFFILQERSLQLITPKIDSLLEKFRKGALRSNDQTTSNPTTNSEQEVFNRAEVRDGVGVKRISQCFIFSNMTKQYINLIQNMFAITLEKSIIFKRALCQVFYQNLHDHFKSVFVDILLC